MGESGGGGNPCWGVGKKVQGIIGDAGGIITIN